MLFGPPQNRNGSELTGRCTGARGDTGFNPVTTRAETNRKSGVSRLVLTGPKAQNALGPTETELFHATERPCSIGTQVHLELTMIKSRHWIIESYHGQFTGLSILWREKEKLSEPSRKTVRIF